MAKVTYHSAEAVRELKNLVNEFKNLNSAVATVGPSAQQSLAAIEKKLFSLQMLSGKTVAAINSLSQALQKNKTASNSAQQSIAGTVDALNKQIATLKKAQSASATSNSEWSKYELKIRAVKNELDKLTATNSKFISGFNKASQGTVNGLNKQIIALRKEQSIKAKTNDEWLKYELKIRAVKHELDKLTATQSKFINTTKIQNTKIQNTVSSLGRMASGFSNIVKGFGALKAVQFFKNLTLAAFEMTKSFDSLNFLMKTISDTSFELGSSQRFLLQISEDYGVELLATSQRYVKFLAAAKQSNLTLADTEKIFGTVTKAASVMSLKTDELSSVYLALEQMLSKGKVTTEELRRQLGERLPGAMGIMAAALDVTIPKLDEMLKKGEVLSADALPKFAEALELAYGTESIKKVDNLVTAQNRLTNVWQLFIADIGKADGALNNFFKDFLSNLTEIIKIFAKLFESPEASLQNEIIEQAKMINVTFDHERDVFLKQNGIFLKKYTRQMELAKEKASLYPTGTKERKQAEADLQKFTALMLKNKEKEDWADKQLARNKIDNARNAYLWDKNKYEKELKIYKELKKKSDDLFWSMNPLNAGAYQKAKSAAQEQLDYLKEIEPEYAKSTAALEKYMKILDRSEGGAITDDDGKSKIDTSNLDKQILIIKNKISDLDYFMSLPSTHITTRLEKIDTMLGLQYDLFQKEYEKEIMLARQHKTKMEIASIEQQQKEVEIKRKWDDKKIKMSQDFFQTGIENIAKNKNYELNEEVNALRDKFAALKDKNKEAYDTFRDQEKELNRKHNNQAILDQIDFIERWMINLGIFGEERIALEQKIQELKSKLKSEFRIRDERTLEDDLETIREFVKEVGNLFDAFSQRRLENIDAEIRAEEQKYDKLISLAENDAKEKEALEKQKDDKLAILEKKRLKEQRKAAIINKAFALADIGMNTAIAYTKALAQGGFIFGIPMAKVMLALGAIQAAAVLATPIPQYAEGIDSVTNDQVAMINDGGKKEYVERNGQILSTDTKNAIVKLRKGDTVHKDYNELSKKSVLYSVIANGQNLSQKQFDRLSSTISSSIKDGFKDVKIAHKFNFNNSNGNVYLKEKSRFNG
jgi:tape measure domain-containing protein